MKKIRVLLLFLLMGICINVKASSPVVLEDVITGNMMQGETIIISTNVIKSGFLGYQNLEIYYEYDSQVFDFVSFETDYDLEFDPKTMFITGDDALFLDEAEVIWTMTFKVKEDALVGDTIVHGKTYSIVEKEKIIDSDTMNNVVVDDKNGNNINIFLIFVIGFSIIVLYIILKKIKKA